MRFKFEVGDRVKSRRERGLAPMVKHNGFNHDSIFTITSRSWLDEDEMEYWTEECRWAFWEEDLEKIE